MVDKEKQWDDMEYSEDEQSSNVDDYENEYSEQDEYEEDNDDYGHASKKKKSNQLPLIIIALLLIGVAGFILISKMNANKTAVVDNGLSASQNVAEENVGDAQSSSSAQDEGDMFFEQAGGNSSDMMNVDFNGTDGEATVKTSGTDGDEVVASVKDSEATSTATGENMFNQTSEELSHDESKENNDIIISYDKVVNSNPFKPPVYKTDKTLVVEPPKPKYLVNDTPFEIIEPPTTSVPDENVTKLLNTQISGILYDKDSPSAIINLNGTDSFVKAGDVISGYKIDLITKDKVQISYKNNQYVASVGELFTKGKLEKQSNIANLEKKFAGRYKN